MPARSIRQHLNGGAVSQLQRFLANVVAGDPSSPAEGEFWYDNVAKTWQFHNGTAAVDLGRLDQITAPTADVSLNSHKITNLVDPTSAQDAATRAYVLANAGGGAGSDTTAVHYLQYDTTGATTGHTALQAAIDAGERNIFIPPGVFLCGGAVFYDQEDGNATLRLNANGVVFRATTSLPTSAEYEAFCTTNSLPTGCKWFIFPSTKRTALSGGVVTGTGNSVTGTATVPTTAGARTGVSPHFLVDGGSWDASLLTKFNAGFCFGNVGGAAELRSMHMGSARHLLSWTGYVDANKVQNIGAWSNTNMDSTYDACVLRQIDSGDAVYILGCKTGNYIRTADLTSCNGAYINSIVGGSVKLDNCHGIVIDTNHTELASNIAVKPPSAIIVRDSHVTIRGSFDYTPDNTTDGVVYLDDSGAEGRHSIVKLDNCFPRLYLSTSDVSDPAGGFAVYINKMQDRTKIHVRDSYSQMSAAGTFGQSYGQQGIIIGGNATNEPTLATATAKSRDIIGSGSFDIVKTQTSTMSTGQNVAMNIEIRAPGHLAGFYQSRAHITPTIYDKESYGSGTLSNSTLYSYAVAVCNTLPDGTIQYGQATAESQQTTPASGGAQGFELYMPTGASGATLVVWRKTGAGVITAPDRYVVLPAASAATRLLDTGANLNKIPWITTSVPVPNTVAATNHTAAQLYFGTVTVASLSTLDQIPAPVADVSLASHKLTNVTDPSSAQDAATKAYVDAAITGLDLREAARVAAKTNITVATGIVNGAVIDGVTLATGDRVLLTAQTAPAENGVYITAASGAASRATDLDAAAEFDQGVLVPVQEGTANKGLYMHTTTGAITLGTTALVFTDLTPRSTGSVSKFTGTGPSSGATSWAIAHNLGTQFVTVQLYDASTLAQIETDIILTDANTATASFASSQTANSIRAVVTG